MEKLRETPVFHLNYTPIKPAEAVTAAFNGPGQPILLRSVFPTFIMAVIVTTVLAKIVFVTFAILPSAKALLLQIAFVLFNVFFGDWFFDFSNASSNLED